MPVLQSIFIHWSSSKFREVFIISAPLDVTNARKTFIFYF